VSAAAAPRTMCPKTAPTASTAAKVWTNVGDRTRSSVGTGDDGAVVVPVSSDSSAPPSPPPGRGRGDCVTPLDVGERRPRTGWRAGAAPGLENAPDSRPYTRARTGQAGPTPRGPHHGSVSGPPGTTREEPGPLPRRWRRRSRGADRRPGRHRRPGSIPREVEADGQSLRSSRRRWPGSSRQDSPVVNWFWRMYAVCSSCPGLLTPLRRRSMARGMPFLTRVDLFAGSAGQPPEAVEVLISTCRAV
jgi:hypothetical protein